MHNSEVHACLKWGGRGEEVIKESQLKVKGVKAETVHGGDGLEGVTTSAPPENIHHTLCVCIACSSGTFMSGNMKNLGQSFKNWKLLMKTTMKE